MELHQVELEGSLVPLLSRVVDHQVLGERIGLVPVPDGSLVLEGAAIAGVSRFSPIVGNTLSTQVTLSLVNHSTSMMVEATLAFPRKTQGAVSLGAGLSRPEVCCHQAPPQGETGSLLHLNLES